MSKENREPEPRSGLLGTAILKELGHVVCYRTVLRRAKAIREPMRGNGYTGAPLASYPVAPVDLVVKAVNSLGRKLCTTH